MNMSSDLDSTLRFTAKLDGAVAFNYEDDRQLRRLGFRGPHRVIMGQFGFLEPRGRVN